MLCHIFAGGVISDLSFISIKDGDMVICADRGYNYAVKLGITPDIIVGDFDSYSGELPDNVEIHRSIPEKDDTDTMLALKLAIERGADMVRIYGAFGGRIDHTLANIQTLKYAADHNCKAELWDCGNIVMLQESGRCSYPRREGWYFSLFSYSERLYVNELSGVKYPLENAEITSSFPLGVSNEITSEAAVLDIKNGTALVVFSRF